MSQSYNREVEASHSGPVAGQDHFMALYCYSLSGGPDYGATGEDSLTRIQRLMAEGGMTAVVQREQSTTMASMGGFGNNIIVSHRIHRSSQTGTESTGADGGTAQPSTSQELVAELEGRTLSESMQVTERSLSPRTSSDDVIEGEEASGQSLSEQAQSSMDTEGPIEYSDLTNNNHLPDNTNFYSNDSTSGESRNR
ncbi:UNVERIFIED_CONTAM: hypothetical protein K2H54_054016 [Gekko kuhli]